MDKQKEEKPMSWVDFEEVLENSNIGLWTIEINHFTGMKKMHCSEQMIELMGARYDFTPEKYFEFWVSRIYEGYYQYIEKCLRKVCYSDEAVKMQYVWRHPEFGDMLVSSTAKLYKKDDSTTIIKGCRQNLKDLNQIRMILSKTENEVFEWYQDINTAYICTDYMLLEKTDVNIENFPYSWIEKGIVEPSSKNVFLSAFERINAGEKKTVCEVRLRNKNGVYSWYRMILSKEAFRFNVDNVVIGTLANIDNLKELQVAYSVESKFYKCILKEMIAYGEFNLNKYKFINTGGLWKTYSKNLDTLDIRQIVEKYELKDIHFEDRQKYLDIIDYDNLMQSYYNNQKIIKFELRRKISSESEKWVEFTCILFKEPCNMDILGLFYIKDIDERKRQELILNHKSKFDGLTDIYNKNAFIEIVNEMIDDSEDDDKLILMTVDLDDFKMINDTYGHSVGDEVLIYISDKLKKVFGMKYCIARFGGDEFVLFSKNISRTEIEHSIELYYNELRKFDKFKIGCSIGVGSSPIKDYEYLFKLSDEALYEVKKSGHKGDYCYKQDFNGTYIEDMQNKEIKYPTLALEEEIENNYKSLDEIISNEGSVAYIVDPVTYKIIDANNSFYALVNKTKEECDGLECYKVLHNRNEPCSFCKNIFWSFKDFFVWKRYNKVLKQDFIIKNKLLKYNDRNAMFTLATAISSREERENNNFSKSISKLILASMYQLAKKQGFENNIKALLEIIMDFFNSECIYMFSFDEEYRIDKYSIAHSDKKTDIQDRILAVVENEFIFNPIREARYISGKQDAMPISYNLYNVMLKYHFSNMLILPLKEGDFNVGYIFCIDNHNFEDYDYLEKIDDYSNDISYLITEEIAKNNLTEKLKKERTYDSLTGLLSRNDYREYEKKYKTEKMKNIGIMCLALNELNDVNHTAGILAGDEILLILAKTLKEVFFSTPIFRLNGNEFLVIMQKISYEQFSDKILNFIEKLAKFNLSVTYGKVWSGEEKELNRLVNYAIYLRKKESQKNIKIDSIDNSYKRNKIRTELLEGIENGKFEVFFQPKISLDTKKIGGAEALIRKKGDDGRYVSPDSFIPLLEGNYLIQYIDLFVFENVLEQLEIWKNEGKEIFPISLNFSRITLLEEDILKKVEEIKDKYTIEPKYIEIEVTESIGDLEKDSIYVVVRGLKALGFVILLDDFGVKYSNISILSNMEFYGLKLDKSMVDNLGENKAKDIIMKNIISMCSELNIKTIAEGVETERQQEILEDMGCDMVQGYLHSRPLPIDEFIKKYLE